MIIKCRTREREGGSLVFLVLSVKPGREGGHLPLGTMIIGWREREGGGGHLILGTMIITCRTRVT